MEVRIKGSEKTHEDIHVQFETDYDQEFYWTHNTTELGSEEDEPRSPTFTAWGWVKHLRTKNWWNPVLEENFLCEIKKHI